MQYLLYGYFWVTSGCLGVHEVVFTQSRWSTVLLHYTTTHYININLIELKKYTILTYVVL